MRRRFDEGDAYFTALEPRMERRHATGVSPAARAAAGDRPRRSTPSSSPASTAATGFPRPIDGCFGGGERCSTPTAATIPARWSWRERWPAPSSAPLVTSTVSRLLVDLNRSIGHPQLFSAATRGAPAALRAKIVERHYRPYRAQVERLVRQAVSRGRRVIHISSHSFTPELDGKVRRADVGLLYRPRPARARPSCARAGRHRSRRSRRSSACAATIRMPARATG